jgi:hypothetical protein
MVTVFLTILAIVVLFVLQSWILPFVWLFTGGLMLLTPARIVAHSIPFVDDEEYAAQHPWRVHLSAALFKGSNVLGEVALWALLMIGLVALSQRIPAVAWTWVYAGSFLLFLSALLNAARLNSRHNSLSHRLRGGTSELRYHHGQRDLMPDEVLGPIAVKRHGF